MSKHSEAVWVKGRDWQLLKQQTLNLMFEHSLSVSIHPIKKEQEEEEACVVSASLCM